MPAPALERVLETVLYYTDADRTEHFYAQVLGFRLIGKEPGRHLFFRVGSSVFLLFDPKSTQSADGRLPPHGSTGPGHVCFLAAGEDFARWKDYLLGCGVAVIQESEWSDEGRSFYFRDPDQNLLEIANTDFWSP